MRAFCGLSVSLGMTPSASVLGGGDDPPVADPARSHQRRTCCGRHRRDVLQHRLFGHRQRAVSGACEHDAFGARRDRRADQRGIGVDVGVENGHLRQRRQRRDIELRTCRVALGRRSIEADLVLVDVTEQPELGRLEGLNPKGVGLGRVTGGVDLVVQNDQHAFGFRIGGNRGANGVEQIQRTVGADRRRWPHRSHHDDRLVRPDGQIEEIRGLFERVRARGDHEPGDGRGLLEDGLDALRQRQPVVDREVGAVDIDDLLDAHIRDLRDLRHRLDQLFAEDRAGLVVRQVGRRGTGAGDGAAGREHVDDRQRARGRRLRRRRPHTKNARQQDRVESAGHHGRHSIPARVS